MSLINCPISLDPAMAVGLFDGVRAKTYAGEAKIDRRTGLPIWLVSISVRLPNVNRRESLTVEVVAESAPEIPFDSTVTLSGLTLTAWATEGRSGFVLRADSMSDSTGTIVMGGAQ